LKGLRAKKNLTGFENLSGLGLNSKYFKRIKGQKNLNRRTEFTTPSATFTGWTGFANPVRNVLPILLIPTILVSTIPKYPRIETNAITI